MTKPPPGPGGEAPATARSRSTGWRRELRRWLLAVALALPAAAPYVAHFGLVGTGGAATGFVGMEAPYYMANAREHFDNGRWQLFYGNPYSPRYTTGAIYFQPQTLVLGLAWRWTGWPPGLVFTGFGLIAAVVCARVVIGLYGVGLAAAGVASGSRGTRLGLWLLAWGGGVLALAGYGAAAWRRGGWPEFMEFHGFDPFGGWWFLNLGRNLVLPTEAYYHALFLGAMWAIASRRYRLALGLVLATSLSHPFTGIELGLIVASWATLERYYVRSAVVSRRFVAGCWGVVGFHLAYYLGVLASHAEHRALVDQWRLAWTLDACAMVPAYGVVGVLAAWRLRTLERARGVLADPVNRLWLVWFGVAFALANHEVVMRPVQPLHFTRGYVWTPLCLLGLATLVGLLRGLPARLGRVPGGVLAGALALGFVSDNAVWLASYPVQAWRGKGIADVRLDAEQAGLLEWLDGGSPPGSLVVCRDETLGYLVGTYTRLRSWVGHPANTPHVGRRRGELAAFFEEGRWPAYWDLRPMMVVLEAAGSGRGEAVCEARGGRLVYATPRYRVVRVDPAGVARGSSGGMGASAGLVR